jgi:hypothetical protein
MLPIMELQAPLTSVLAKELDQKVPSPYTGRAILKLWMLLMLGGGAQLRSF